MIAVYFSGTGNTKHCAERLLRALDPDGKAYPLESGSALYEIGRNSDILFAYPVYYSALPKIVRDFIADHSDIWKGKNILIVATMGMFSGDGAGCAKRLFGKYGAKVLGGLHVKMPDCIGDVKLLKKSADVQKKLVAEADKKIDSAALRIRSGKYPKNGLSFACRIAGLFGQRLYFYGKTKKYYGGIKADPLKCAACGHCVSLCPMHNISSENGRITFHGKCTMCYRCFSGCPNQAIRILGKRVYEQYRFEDLMK